MKRTTLGIISFLTAAGASVLLSTCTDNSATAPNGLGANKSVAIGLRATPTPKLSATGCPTGSADCNATAGDGCEINTFTDESNCGACGKVCPTVNNVVYQCVTGRCMPGACAAGWANCLQQNQLFGCETAVGSSTSNCGACGNVCTGGANGTPVCTAGVCGQNCNPGFADCNAVPGDGCEIDTTTDVNNCGACGTICTLGPNVATVGCTASACVILTCNAGFADCNGTYSDGCEADTTADPSNCGACGTVCPDPPGATGTCTASTCGFTCTAPFLDCNLLPGDGCEVNSSVDPANCGACATACTVGEICSAGACTVLPPVVPPAACTAGTDAGTGSPYVVCSSSPTTAWISSVGGGSYHALQICQSFGYTSIGQTGGNCGNECGACFNSNPSCSAPGTPFFDGGGTGCGSDAFGPVLCSAVMWTCQ